MQSEEFPKTLTSTNYTETTSFLFKCEILGFADKDFLVHHYIDSTTTDIVGKKRDSRSPSRVEDTTSEITLKVKPTFKVYLNHTHWEDLSQALNSISFYHSASNEPASIKASEDDLKVFLSSQNTTHLFRTEEYQISEKVFLPPSFTVSPRREIYKQKEVTSQFIFPTGWADVS